MAQRVLCGPLCQGECVGGMGKLSWMPGWALRLVWSRTLPSRDCVVLVASRRATSAGRRPPPLLQWQAGATAEWFTAAVGCLKPWLSGGRPRYPRELRAGSRLAREKSCGRRGERAPVHRDTGRNGDTWASPSPLSLCAATRKAPGCSPGIQVKLAPEGSPLPSEHKGGWRANLRFPGDCSPPAHLPPADARPRQPLPGNHRPTHPQTRWYLGAWQPKCHPVPGPRQSDG